ncbi:hypothetical protein [Streptomyces sp. NPDC002889]
MSTRTHLPDPVNVGVEYRNVQVRYRLSNTLGVEGPPADLAGSGDT